MNSILPTPLQPFVDENGNPLSAGKIFSYSPNTLVAKPTYASDGSLNPNPMVLSPNGTFPNGITGEGDYRFLVKDQNDVVLIDLGTSSYLKSDQISPAMAPVVSAETVAIARTLMGIDGALQAWANTISLMPGPIGPTGPTGPTGGTGATGLKGDGYWIFFSGGNPSSFYLPGLNQGANSLIFQTGFNQTDASGSGTFYFQSGFPNECLGVWCNTGGVSWWANATSWTSSSFTATTSSPLVGGSWVGGPMGFSFLALGY